MPITVRQLCDTQAFNLTVRAGEEHLERELSWAHVSELEDPTAFLSGGELLLTTGVSLPADAEAIEERVRRLVAAGVAAVGFGVGLRFDTVPDAFVAAARAEQLPLLEVPLAVPFIVLEKAVSQALSSDDHARLQRTHQQQRRLIHATLAADGARTLVRRTAELIGGWAALLDAAGHVVHGSHRTVRGAVNRTAPQRIARPGEVVFSSEGGEDIISQPLAAVDGRVLGYLVAGRQGVVGSLDHGVVTVAASLLTLFVRRTDETQRALARARAAALRLLIAGQMAATREVSQDLWGGFPSEPVKVITAVGSQSALNSAIAVLDTGPSGAAIFGRVEGHLLVVVSEASVEKSVSRLVTVSDLRLGISENAWWDEFARARRESRQAADEAAQRNEGALHFAQLGGEGLASYLDRYRARSYAENHLSVLQDAGSTGREGSLCRTLRSWLTHNGQIDPAAKDLGIHRHTLRRRLDRIENLLGVSLNSPATRAELWFELELLGENTNP
ncbi:PucR family transcriptional regulator [Rhodococcus sp. IEGM 248]|uniref:PucR family transcriptional regulator n=1 Tax=Rhodococcus opacus TaxID=37919 RepID=UPI0013C1A737|nr:PucR family transcriptional regulator [Rhodococcus opacus]MDV7087871.1 PucR family transcriptional regulator ligand-binding domain-containing protein [Rhodococcus opacus]NDV08534.1 PucR family transcriptional regulator [Rhodococcus sp. IEGM 248]